MVSTPWSSLLPTAAGLAMDSAALAVAYGLSGTRRADRAHFKLALAFGFFQGLLFAIGWISGSEFRASLAGWDHWIAFLLLVAIGGKMLKESFASDGTARTWNLTWMGICGMALATSVDALAVGIGFSLVGGGLFVPAMVVGVFAFVLPLLAYYGSSAFGARLGSWAERLGGILLIAIGARILIEHLALGI
jgi:putative Mn2+ efflux pump MntP